MIRISHALLLQGHLWSRVSNCLPSAELFPQSAWPVLRRSRRDCRLAKVQPQKTLPFSSGMPTLQRFGIRPLISLWCNSVVRFKVYILKPAGQFITCRFQNSKSKDSKACNACKWFGASSYQELVGRNLPVRSAALHAILAIRFI